MYRDDGCLVSLNGRWGFEATEVCSYSGYGAEEAPLLDYFSMVCYCYVVWRLVYWSFFHFYVKASVLQSFSRGTMEIKLSLIWFDLNTFSSSHSSAVLQTMERNYKYIYSTTAHKIEPIFLIFVIVFYILTSYITVYICIQFVSHLFFGQLEQQNTI